MLASRRPQGGGYSLSALHWRHDGNLLARFELVVAIDKFHARTDQNALVVSAKCRSFRISHLEQFAYSRAFRKIDIQLTDSNQIAQLRVKLHMNFHCIMSFLDFARHDRSTVLQQ